MRMLAVLLVVLSGSVVLAEEKEKAKAKLSRVDFSLK